MKRYRLVYQLGDAAPHVSSVIFTACEVEEQLEAEALLHRMAEWQVEEGEQTVVCRRGDLVRTITIRESGPMDDESQ